MTKKRGFPLHFLFFLVLAFLAPSSAFAGPYNVNYVCRVDSERLGSWLVPTSEYTYGVTTKGEPYVRATFTVDCLCSAPTKTDPGGCIDFDTEISAPDPLCNTPAEYWGGGSILEAQFEDSKGNIQYFTYPFSQAHYGDLGDDPDSLRTSLDEAVETWMEVLGMPGICKTQCLAAMRQNQADWYLGSGTYQCFYDEAGWWGAF